MGKNDVSGKNEKLQCLRTKEGKEVDFALINNENEISEIIEVKLSDNEISKNLIYFAGRYSLEGRQIVKNLKREKSVGGIKVVRAQDYLEKLFL